MPTLYNSLKPQDASCVIKSPPYTIYWQWQFMFISQRELWKPAKRNALSQILWVTQNPRLCQNHFIPFASIIELLLFISTNSSVCWPAPRIFGKAPSIFQNHIYFVTEGMGVKPMVASVVLKIRCAPKSEKWSDLDFMRFYLCHVVRCHFMSNYFQKRPTRFWKT